MIRTNSTEIKIKIIKNGNRVVPRPCGISFIHKEQ